MELYHHHGGGRLLVDLLDPVTMESPRWSFAIVMDLVEKTHLTYLPTCSHVCHVCIFRVKGTCISPFA